MSTYSLITKGERWQRPKSEDKRNAILSAPSQAFAERGLGAATSAISSVAGVAEGTLFAYFNTKDELVNALYREIKLELADAMMSGFPRKKNIRSKLQHIWDGYVNWGLANPDQRTVLAQLQASNVLPRNPERRGARHSSRSKQWDVMRLSNA
jgi:AcrR family transcriptional regulator